MSAKRRIADYAGAEDLDLTAREREVLQLLREGKSNAEIGRDMGASPSTVSSHLFNIKVKLDFAAFRKRLQEKA